MQRHPMTPEGFRALQDELQNLKSVVRPRIVRDIEEARAHGDISENSEYEDAKERQAHCEGRVGELETLLAGADVIDVRSLPQDERVVFGVSVQISNAAGEERLWRIVGEAEASIRDGRISYRSPLGRALIGRSVGEEVRVPAPSGEQVWEIVEVRYQ
jgi:transcription elongation factor GreA